jgi:hypothetical protein
VPPSTPPVDSNGALARMEPLRPMPVHQVSTAMQEYQQGLQSVLVDGDWQLFRDRDGRERRFVKRSGWRKIGTWFGLDLTIRSVKIDRVERHVCPSCGHVYVEQGVEGDPLRASVVASVIAPNGRKAEDVGACAIGERRFSKPEHDLVATAATRAINRATSNLVGMGEVTAEEVVDDVEPMLPTWALPASDADTRATRERLGALLSDTRGDVLLNAITKRYDYLPNVVVGLVNAMHSMLTGTAPGPVGQAEGGE